MKSLFILFLLSAGLAISARAQQPSAPEQVKDLPPLPRGQQVCVLGNVAKPTAITVEGTLSLMQAIRAAGGPTPNMSNRVHIFRRRPGGFLGVIQVKDLKAVAKGRATDVLLYPEDVVQVLSRSKRTLIPLQRDVPCDSRVLVLLLMPRM